MSRLNPPPFSLRPRRPGILKRARSEIAALQTGRRLVITSKLAMPVEKSGESLPALPDSSYILPVKATGKDAPNAEVTDSEFDGDEDSGVLPSSGDKEKPTRPWNGRALRLIKAWNIGPTQTQPVEDSRQELFALSRKFMDVSKLFKLPTHSVNATDLHLWKQYHNYGSFKSGNKRVFRCPAISEFFGARCLIVAVARLESKYLRPQTCLNCTFLVSTTNPATTRTSPNISSISKSWPFTTEPEFVRSRFAP
jgi:hypothetical protein